MDERDVEEAVFIGDRRPTVQHVDVPAMIDGQTSLLPRSDLAPLFQVTF